MKPPTLRADYIEQAVFAWTNRTITNARGQGFAAVSDGLTQATSWLQSLDETHFELLDQSINSRSRAYEGWRSFSSVGYFRDGEIGIAYRKMANGGVDGSKRPRHVVHLLMGLASEVNISMALLLDERHWLRAEDCPIDMPLRLHSLSRSMLQWNLAPVRHKCDHVDRIANGLLQDVLNQKAGEWIQLRPEEVATLAASIHITMPDVCRQTLELDTFVGMNGPVGYLRIADVDASWDANAGVGAVGEDASLRTALEAKLTSCVLHKELSPIWPLVPSDGRAWHVYGAQIRAMRSGKPPQ